MQIEDYEEGMIVKNSDTGSYYKVVKVATFGSMGTIVKAEEMFKDKKQIVDLFASEAMVTTTQEVAEKVMSELGV